MWEDLKRWNQAVIKAPGSQRKLVFCYSLGDVFEANDTQLVNHKGEPLWTTAEYYRLHTGYQGNLFTPIKEQSTGTPVTHSVVRERLFRCIEEYRGLIFLLLTKRPENVYLMAPAKWMHGGWPDNAWIGTTAETQEYADERVKHLIEIPAPVRFLSVEPMLGPVSYREALARSRAVAGRLHRDYIQWVIVGGESRRDGKTRDARIMQLEWVKRLGQECITDGIPFFFKQWGDYIPFSQIPDGAEMPDSNMAETSVVIGDNDYYCLGTDANGDRLDGKQYHQFPAQRYRV